jgi:hypothetical protein
MIRHCVSIGFTDHMGLFKHFAYFIDYRFLNTNPQILNKYFK